MRSNIRQLRKEKHISQKELGDAIGLSQQIVSRIECDRSKIQVDVLMNLADYFHVSTDCVLGYQRSTDVINPLEEALMMQSAASSETLAVIDNLEQMDRGRRLMLWQRLAELKEYLG